MKKCIALADVGRICVGPTSSVKGCLASNVIGVGVSLLEPLRGGGAFFLWPCTVGAAVEASGTVGEVVELFGSSLPLPSSQPWPRTPRPRPLAPRPFPLFPLIPATGEAKKLGETGLSGLSDDTELSGEGLQGEKSIWGKGETGLSEVTVVEMGDSSRNCMASALSSRLLFRVTAREDWDLVSLDGVDIVGFPRISSSKLRYISLVP